MGGLPDLPIGQPLYVEGKPVQLPGQLLFFVHLLLVRIFKVLCNFLLLLSRFLESFLGLFYGIFGYLRKFLLHGFVLLEFLFKLLKKFLGRELGQLGQTLRLSELLVHLFLDPKVLFDLAQVFPCFGYFLTLVDPLEMIGDGLQRFG